jgi:hypothetical protein
MMAVMRFRLSITLPFSLFALLFLPAAAQAVCPVWPSGWSPKGDLATRFTVLYRINQPKNVTSYSDPALAIKVRPQDLFLVNTRFFESEPARFTEIVDQLHASFPCNRVVALNGQSSDPALPGYAFALASDPRLYAALFDWEPMVWNQARAQNLAMQPWTARFQSSLTRVNHWLGLLNGVLRRQNPSRVRVGLVPADFDNWNYGDLAQLVDVHNRGLGWPHLGLQSVQTQYACSDLGPIGFKKRVYDLLKQYRYRRVNGKGKKRLVKRKQRDRPSPSNLSVQVSLSPTPDPFSPQPVTKTSAAQAAACVRSGLKAGGGAFLFWANPEAMKLFFADPKILALRP